MTGVVASSLLDCHFVFTQPRRLGGEDRGVRVLLGGPAGVQNEVGTEFLGPIDEDGAWFGLEVTQEMSMPMGSPIL